MTTLQSQGVPIPDSLPAGTSGNRGRLAYNRQRLSRRGGTQGPRYAPRERGNRPNRVRETSRSLTSFSPVRVADKSTSGVGLLEAEFFGSLVLLILLMFAGTQTYASKVMTVMKRGTLLCILFFILALVAAAGPNAAKVSKGLGALIVVAVLLTTPVTSMITDVDNIIKNDWVGSAEHGTDVGSSDQNPTGGSGGTGLAPAEGAIQRILQILNGFARIGL